MKKLLLLVLAGALMPAAAHAQATPAAPAAAAAATAVPAAPVPESAQEAILPTGVVAPAPVAAAKPVAASTSSIKLAPVTPAANPNAIRIKADVNAATGRLTVKTDNPGPTRVELTDVGGRPVLTHAMMNGQTPIVLNVSRLPAGTYVVHCTAYEKTGMRRIMIGR